MPNKGSQQNFDWSIRPNTIEEANAFMLAALPMFTRVGAAALKPGLDNIVRMSKAIGEPHTKFKSIHIAGTNGKGSTAHCLAAILQAAGYKVGLHTSPHLKNFNERIRVNGEPIADNKIVEFINANWELWQKVKPSYFEYGVLLAFDTFAKANVDVAIIEVGLGGRLDSTNIITPILSVITNISFDHTQLLGNTLEKIASEKAGIIKPNIPVVVGEVTKETLPVFIQTAEKNRSQLFVADEILEIIRLENGTFNALLTGDQNRISFLNNIELELKGNYQEKNLKTILTSVLNLKEWFNISPEDILEGLANVTKLTGLKGRWQILQEAPLVIADTGHNEAGIHLISKQLGTILTAKKADYPKARLWIIIGMVADKDIEKMLALLPKYAEYYFCQADIPRALPAVELQKFAAEFNLVGPVISSVNLALAEVLTLANENDVVFVGGSTFVVAELEQL